MLKYPSSVEALMEQLKRLPSVGPRGAERLALWLIAQGKEAIDPLASSLKKAEQEVTTCSVCGFFCEGSHCEACLDEKRRRDQICVVEQACDVLPIERCGSYGGLYHCLGGRLSPLNDVEPEDLRIGGLFSRLEEKKEAEGSLASVEVILALSSDMEGEATAHYLTHLLTPLGCKVTRLAQGLPAGSGLGFADPLTLSRAFSHRRSSED